MQQILDLPVSRMAGLQFSCSCGREHSIGIRAIEVGSNVLGKAVELAAPYRDGTIFLMADSNTYGICGSKTEDLFRAAGFCVKSYVFQQQTPLVPDERALGRLLMEMDANTSLVVSVGSGTLNDLARMLSYKCHVPYFIVGTAPSMDGYASTVSPLIIGGFKTTIEAVFPAAIIGELSVIRQAPMEMIRAGFGDILGKYTALTDWILSRERNGEYYCPTSAAVMENAVKKCADNLTGIAARDEAAVGYLTEALILSGVAMGLVGNSRPASGAEHHMAHYWEMDALARGEEHPLHGNAVGVAALISALVYERMGDCLPAACHPPEPGKIEQMLRELGAADSPKTLGIRRELFHRGVLEAMNIRERYTVLRLAAEKGRLAAIADELTERFYGK